MPIVGTAGHVDHGKSALVTALTGTNPDRFLEERLRGMTLDLGFARLQLDDGQEAGIVDVPGHERFLHNMLAGAAGMEVVLLVVAADEGVMPQTREHLDVLGLLGVRRPILVVSKIDLIQHDARAGAIARIASDLRGTIAEDAPIAAVSAREGEGLPALRALIAQMLRDLPAPDVDAPTYLPIDRAFSLAGRGTIVTGTLMQGRVREGDVLTIEPGGRRGRVRGIEVFGAARHDVGPGTRVALNLAGVERSELARGQSAAGPEAAARDAWDVSFVPLEAAVPLLRRKTPVRVYLGAAEILGTIVFKCVPRQAERVSGRLMLREPAIAFPGVRFVLRRPSPKTLLGGGRIEGVADARSFDAPTRVADAVLSALRARGLHAAEPQDLSREANVREPLVRTALAALAARDQAIELRRPHAFADAAASRELLAAIVERLETAQRDEPWSLGLTSLALARRLNRDEPLLVRYLDAFTWAGRIAARAGYYATPQHRPRLSDEQRAWFRDVLAADPAAPLRPHSFSGVRDGVRTCGVLGMARAFDTLLAAGELVKVGNDLYRAEQIAAIRARVRAHFERSERMTAAEFRDAIGTSRKYAVPLLEWLDAAGMTVRDGDYRRPRAAARPAVAGSTATIGGKSEL